MKASLFVLILFAISHSSLGQEFLDKNWKQVFRKSEATYYRTVEVINDLFLVTDYYLSNNGKQMEGVFGSVTPKMIHHGECRWYYENGNIKKEGFYENDACVGIFKTYYEDGLPESEIIYPSERRKELRYSQFWTNDGAPLLKHGTGTVHKEIKDRDVTSVIRYQDSVIIRSYEVRHQQADTVYIKLDNTATYKTGMDGLLADIRKHLVYPKSARKEGIQGQVFVQFIVDSKGNVIEEEVIKELQEDCDKAALTAVSKLGKWNPAIVQGEGVNMRFVLPINFRFK